MYRLGTRGSRLARTQSQWVGDQLTALGQKVELAIITTAGDNQSVPLNKFARPGAFVAALQEAVLDKRCDLAVHSFKDLPSAQVNGLVLAAVPQRASNRDLLITPDGFQISELPRGARIGTSSPRRVKALQRLRPDLNFTALRGNVETRIRAAMEGRVDGVVLAQAGLERLGLLTDQMRPIDFSVLLPAPAQGALAVECRVNDPIGEVIAKINDTKTRICVQAERGVLAGVDAACTTAVGAHAYLQEDDMLCLEADLADWLGVDYARTSESTRLGDNPLADAKALGIRVAETLLASAK